MRKDSNNAQPITDILIDATEIFGSAEGAKKWLTSYNLALNAVPIRMLEKEVGALPA